MVNIINNLLITIQDKENLLNSLKSRINNIYHLDSQLAKDDRLIIHINAKES